MSGLNNVEFINGEFYIRANPELENLNGLDNLKSIVYDPNDIARITNKQTTMAQNVMGNFQKQEQAPELR